MGLAEIEIEAIVLLMEKRQANNAWTYYVETAISRAPVAHGGQVIRSSESTFQTGNIQRTGGYQFSSQPLTESLGTVRELVSGNTGYLTCLHQGCPYSRVTSPHPATFALVLVRLAPAQEGWSKALPALCLLT